MRYQEARGLQAKASSSQERRKRGQVWGNLTETVDDYWEIRWVGETERNVILWDLHEA